MTRSAVIGNVIAAVAAIAVWSAQNTALAETPESGGSSSQSSDTFINLAQSELPANAKIDRNAGEERGAVTNLPLPRYVSLKGSEGNARRGPSLSHRIDWVFRHAGMPLRVVAEFGHWRRVEDKDGAGGWVHYALLSGVRTAVVVQDMAELRARPEPDSDVVARAESGAIVKLGECNPDWCSISGGGERGWVPKTDIWGADPGEIRE